MGGRRLNWEKVNKQPRGGDFICEDGSLSGREESWKEVLRPVKAKMENKYMKLELPELEKLKSDAEQRLQRNEAKETAYQEELERFQLKLDEVQKAIGKNKRNLIRIKSAYHFKKTGKL